MTHQMAHMTWEEIKDAIAAERMVIVPCGATEAHGPHMPTDTDTHQAEYMAIRLAERVDAVVAPPVAYGVSKTFEHFAGTISLSIVTYQQVVYEVGAALIKQGFKHVLLLNGNRPNGTSNDAVARRLIDDLDQGLRLQGHRGQLLGAGRRGRPRAAQVGCRRHGPRRRVRDFVPARDPARARPHGPLGRCPRAARRLGSGCAR